MIEYDVTYDVSKIRFYLDTINERGTRVPDIILESFENIAKYIENDRLEKLHAKQVVGNNDDAELYTSDDALEDITNIIRKMESSAYNNAAASTIHDAYIFGLKEGYDLSIKLDNLNDLYRYEIFGEISAREIKSSNSVIELMHKLEEWEKNKYSDTCEYKESGDYCKKNNNFCSCVDPFDECAMANYEKYTRSGNSYKKGSTVNVNRLLKGAKEITNDVKKDIYDALMYTSTIVLTKDGNCVLLAKFDKRNDIYMKDKEIYVHFSIKCNPDIDYVNGCIMRDSHGFPIYQKNFDNVYANKYFTIDIVVNID